MKKVFFVLLQLFLINSVAYTQDTIIKINGDKIIGDIIKEDSLFIYVKNTVDNENKVFSTIIRKTEISSFRYDNKNNSSPFYSNIDKLNIGLGLGLDYGVLGFNLLYYPQRNIGLFGGLGYAFAGTGFNVGAKLRIVSKNSLVYTAPYSLIMYGYNASVIIINAPELSKIYYGPTLGFGLDFKLKTSSKNYITLAILIPIRSPEVQEYIDHLKKAYGIEFKNGLPPIAFSIGYRKTID